MIEHRVYGNVKEIDIDHLRKLFEKIDYVSSALLFGSRASGTNTRKSDYDFAVFSKNKQFKFGLRAELFADISESTKIDMQDMDIVDLQKADEFILKNIRENYIILKGSKDEVARLLR